MASKNRAALITKALKVVKKHYKPSAPPPKDRTLLQHLLVACCLENSPQDAAERVFQSLTNDYFDWNEVRVSTVKELSEACKPLNDPIDAATRLKRVLQSVFETHYSFDLESMKKQNIGAAVKTLEKYNGSTPFVVAYVTQQALGGHSIPVNQGLLESLRIVGVVTDAEAAKGIVPGLERTVPKSKGAEVGSQLHQLGVEMHRSPYGPTIRKLLLEIDPSCKDQLPKRITKVEEPPPPAPAPPAKPAAKAPEPPAKKTAVAKKPSVDGAAKTPTAKKKVKKAIEKKPKPAAAKSGAKKKAAAGKTLTKRKPR